MCFRLIAAGAQSSALLLVSPSATITPQGQHQPDASGGRFDEQHRAARRVVRDPAVELRHVADPDLSGNLGGGARRFTVTFDYNAKKMYLVPNQDLARPDPFDRSGHRRPPTPNRALIKRY